MSPVRRIDRTNKHKVPAYWAGKEEGHDRMVDWRIFGLADRGGLNWLYDGGRVPRQVFGSKLEVVAGLSVPRGFRYAGPVVRVQGAGRVRGG